MIKEEDVTTYAAQQLRALRTTMGITQSQLADEIGVSPQQVQKYENGINRLSAGKVMQCADAFEVSVLVFFPKRDALDAAEPVPPPSVRFLRLLSRIPANRHKELYAALKALVELATGQESE